MKYIQGEKTKFQ